jgi:hypothetical protein
MGFTIKKYRVSVSFYHKLAFFGRTEDQHHWIFLKLIKTYIQDYYV